MTCKGSDKLNRGKFIVIEGPDASGKGELVKRLKKDYPLAVFTREPGGTDVSDKIRELLLDDKYKINSMTELFLYSASRSEYIKEVMEKLNAGNDVISERYVYSTKIYQGYAGEIELDIIEKINNIFLDILKPDQIIFLNLTLDEYNKRVRERGNMDRMEKKGDLYFEKVIEGYNKLSKETKENKISVMTNGLTPDEIYEIIKKHIIL